MLSKPVCQKCHEGLESFGDWDSLSESNWSTKGVVLCPCRIQDRIRVRKRVGRYPEPEEFSNLARVSQIPPEGCPKIFEHAVGIARDAE